jgi:hypothetical protein
MFGMTPSRLSLIFFKTVTKWKVRKYKNHLARTRARPSRLNPMMLSLLPMP